MQSRGGTEPRTGGAGRATATGTAAGSASGPLDRAWLGPAAVALTRRPGLWPTALRQLVSLAEPGWWRHAPRLPLPSAAYLRFRLVTAYGDPTASPAPGDVVTYLGWCRDERRRGRARSRHGFRNAPGRALAGR